MSINFGSNIFTKYELGLCFPTLSFESSYVDPPAMIQLTFMYFCLAGWKALINYYFFLKGKRKREMGQNPIKI